MAGYYCAVEKNPEPPAAAEMGESEERYRTLFGAIDECFCVLEPIVDPQGRAVDLRYVDANPAFERQSGFRGVVGRTVREPTPGREPPWMDVYASVAHSGQPQRLVERVAFDRRWDDLASLTLADREALNRHLKPIRLELRQGIYDPGEPISHVYFPQSGLVSIIVTSREGTSVEVGPVGCDGVIGLPVFLGEVEDRLEAFIQVGPLQALRVRAPEFQEACERLPSLQRVMRRYVQWTYYGMAQWVLCARLHPVEERLVRWLLMCHDRLGGERFPMTQEFLAEMLGVRRPTVTIAASMLKKAGLVDYSRGVVTILDRAGLERSSCECWRTTLEEYCRLIGSEPGFPKASGYS